MKRSKSQDTSWEEVEGWYTSVVGEEGHYYHRSLIIPGAKRLLEIEKNPEKSVLDIGCGQGVFARALLQETPYCGIDASSSLLREAKKLTPRKNARFILADATKELPFQKELFDSAIFILSLQNMEDQQTALRQARKYLVTKGRLLLILNHPCFRIPRQSSWGIDEASKLQYRRINRYQSPLKIPIQMNPSKQESSSETYSFHHSLSDYFLFLKAASFVTLQLEEWCSDKKSEGSKARMEDRARKEFPLFLAILARAE